MKVAIDINGVITEYPPVFRLLSQHPDFEVTILTNLPDAMRDDLAQGLTAFGIRFKEIVTTRNKAKYIIENGIELYFDDTDDYFIDLPPSVCVCKVRGSDNFNFQTGRWVYNRKTGEMRNETPDETIDLTKNKRSRN